MNVVLIGFRCAGKSSVGRKLADRLRCPFVDCDEYIEAKTHLKIREIFDLAGESHLCRAACPADNPLRPLAPEASEERLVLTAPASKEHCARLPLAEVVENEPRLRPAASAVGQHDVPGCAGDLGDRRQHPISARESGNADADEIGLGSSTQVSHAQEEGQRD